MARKRHVREGKERLQQIAVKILTFLQILRKHKTFEHIARVSGGTCTCEMSRSQSFLSLTVNQFLRCLLKVFVNCEVQYK